MAELHSTLPPSWTVKTLEEVCELITDGTHQTPIYSNKGYIFLSARNVTSGKINWENIKYIPQELHDKLYNRLAPQLNDILLAKNGTTGVAAIVDKECVFDIYVSLALLRPKQNTIFPLYLLYSLQDVKVQEQFRGKLIGMGVPNLHLRDIRTTTLPIPPLEEQKEIVKILDSAFERLDHSLENCKQALTLTKELWQSSLDKALSHREGWAIENLEENLEKLIDYRGKTPVKADKGIMTLSARSVKMNYIDYSKVYFVSKDTYKIHMTRGFPEKGDILMTSEAPLGCIAELDRDDICIAQRLLLLRGKKEKLLNRYLMYYLQSSVGQHELLSRATGSTVQGIKRTRFSKVIIPIPPQLKEQKEIVAKLDKIQDFIKKLEYDYTNKILYIKELKSSLLNDAFTGKLTNKE